MKLEKIMNLKWIMVFLSLFLAGCLVPTSEMTSKAISVPLANSALQIVHKERHNTGGFSALSMSADCRSLVVISDYSQAIDLLLDKPVRRSGWYQAQIKYNQDGRLKKLVFNKKGQLKDLDGSILQGATESMAKEKTGYLVSFDDRGTIYRYTATKKIPDALNNIPTIAYSQENLGEGNFGLESIALLESGDLLALWETKKDATFSPGRILRKNGEQVDIKFYAGASPGGATKLKDGTIIILEKRWLGKNGQRLKIDKIAKEKLSADILEISHEVYGTTILDHISQKYDNNEGIGSCIRNGKEWLFVITDDNGDWPRRNVEDKGHSRQRTLLMQFDLGKLSKQP